MTELRGEEKEKGRRKMGGDRERETSRPKASNGQRFPCPVLLLSLNKIFLVFLRESRAAALIGDKVL